MHITNHLRLIGQCLIGALYCSNRMGERFWILEIIYRKNFTMSSLSLTVHLAALQSRLLIK